MSETQSQKSPHPHWSLPYMIQIEQRLSEPPRWYPWVVSLGAIVVALFIGGILIAIVGGNPFASMRISPAHRWGALAFFQTH
jgi:hypothetical protein